MYLYSDGPARPELQHRVEQGRALAGAVDWPCEIATRFPQQNGGTRHGISAAISWFFEHEEEGIIIEEDAMPDPSFFGFCGEALARYRREPGVAQVCGANPYHSFLSGQKVRFCKWGGPWAWATWRRAWAEHDPRDDEIIRNWACPDLQSWLGRPSAVRLWRNRQMAVQNRWVTTYDFPWALHCLSRRMLSLLPATNLVDHIGHGKDATHCLEINRFFEASPAMPHPMPAAFPETIAADGDIEALSLSGALGEITTPELTASALLSEPLTLLSALPVLHRAAELLDPLLPQSGREIKPKRGMIAGIGAALRRFVRTSSLPPVVGKKLASHLRQVALELGMVLDPLEIRTSQAAKGSLADARISFCAAGEDLVIESLLRGREKGFYLDIGASDPFVESKTFRLHRQGWRGINILPSREVWKRFLLSRRFDVNLLSSVGGDPSVPSLSQGEQEGSETGGSAQHPRSGQLSGVGFTLAGIFGQHLPEGVIPDLLVLNHREQGLEILGSNDWLRYRPEIVACAGGIGKPEVEPADGSFLVSHGYGCVAATRDMRFFRVLHPD